MPGQAAIAAVSNLKKGVFGMKLSLQSIQDAQAWKGYHLPQYDVAAVAARTKAAPRWLHFGAGNIFRAFPCVVAQRLIENGDMDTGIVCCEGYDDEIVTSCFHPVDNLTIAVTLNPDGNIDKEVVGSLCESLTMKHDAARVAEIFRSDSLQMVSFTITEKGYSLRNAQHELMPAVAEDMANGPAGCKSFMAQLAALCIERFRAGAKPLALVSMDNCSHNGEKLQNAVMEIVEAWQKNGRISAEEAAYFTTGITFPWSMIDKITPRPNESVEAQLTTDGVEDVKPFVTTKHTYIAPFVNAEKPQYLVIEDLFPGGRPPLEKAGIIFTNRDTVNRVEQMKVGTCLNPLHTCLAVYGCLLGYTSIAAEMKDEDLVRFITEMSYKESLPFVVNPGIIDPEQFLNEVLTVRFPNPFMPDTPQRIATDTSQKLCVRFGETIKAYMASPEHKASELKLIPLVLAGWLRYLIGIDDEGKQFDCSPDPLLDSLQSRLSDARLGAENNAEMLRPILSDASIFAVDLYEAGLADKVAGYWQELMAGPGAVRATVKKYVDT